MHPVRKPPPVMTLTVNKTRISLALQQVRKSAFVWRVRCVSCVCTKLHMSGYLFVHTCIHVTCSNKILVNEPVTTSPMNARACCIGTSKKQDEARQCRQHAHVREKRYSLPCENKKRSEITGQRPCCGRACTSSGTATLITPENMMGLGVRETGKSVRQAPSR
jgi:hypothetical protein